MFALACWIANLFFRPLVYLTLCWTISLFLLFSKVWFWFCLLVLVIPLLPFTPKSGHSNYQDQGQYWYKAFFNVSKSCKRSDVIFQRIYYADKRIFIYLYVMTRYFWILHDSCYMKSWETMIAFPYQIPLSSCSFRCSHAAYPKSPVVRWKWNLYPMPIHITCICSLHIFVSFTSREGRRCNSKAMQIKK